MRTRSLAIPTLVLLLVGCATKAPLPSAAPVLHARINQHAIRCSPMNCAKHAYAGCEPNGGMRSWAIVEEPNYGTNGPDVIEVECVGRCWNGNEVVYDCRPDPIDWRLTEARR